MEFDSISSIADETLRTEAYDLVDKVTADGMLAVTGPVNLEDPARKEQLDAVFDAAEALRKDAEPARAKAVGRLGVRYSPLF